MTNQQMDAILQQQKSYLSTRPLLHDKERVAWLKKLRTNILEMRQEISEALYQDLNKSEIEGYMSEIGLVLDEIRFMIKHCRSYSAPRRVPTPLAQFPSKSFVMPCAYGQVLIISPWNYPFMLAMTPLVDAIAAGNLAIIKPSELSPHVSDVIAKLIAKTFDPKEVSVILGGKEECTYLLDQDFDYIFYTGSTRVGKIVMQKAAEHFTPVTLEMGGKSPCIVDSTADISLSAKRIVFGKFLNCGQTCVAPDYILVDTKVKDQLVKELSRQIVLQYSVDPLSNPTYPKMINQKQFDAMLSLLDKDKIVFGGKRNRDTLKIEPTIVEAGYDDGVMEEEIFGPILPIVTFDGIEDAIVKVNSLAKPLALYIFSTKKENQQMILDRCDFGGGCINDTIIHISSPHLGFGGLKESGIGAYHGKVGFDTFTHYKSILNKKRWLDLPMRYQPYNKWKYWFIKMFLR